MKKNLLVFGFLCALLGGSVPLCSEQEVGGNDRAALRGRADAAAPRPAGVEAGQPDVDLNAVRSQLQLFQEMLNRDLGQVFENPFALLQDVKGIYLPRFGVAFHMEVNLLPLRGLNPFDLRPYTEEELRQARESKLARIRQLKDRLSELLAQHGAELSAIPAEQYVAVVVHLFNMPSEKTDGLPKQLVIEASRQALLDFKTRQISAEDFRKQVSFLEF